MSNELTPNARISVRIPKVYIDFLKSVGFRKRVIEDVLADRIANEPQPKKPTG